MKKLWIRVFENEQDFAGYIVWCETQEELLQKAKEIDQKVFERKLYDFEVCDF